MKVGVNQKVWKDTATVIGIVVIFIFITFPFINFFPNFLSDIFGHYSSTLGYLWLCYRAKKVEVKHLIIIAMLVCGIKMTTYTLMFWSLIGTKYTIKGIIGGGFISEAVSVFVGSLFYVAGRELRYYYKYYLKGSA